MKKRSFNLTGNRFIDISLTNLNLSEWLDVILFVLLAIVMYLLKFLGKYILKALDLIVTLTIAFLIIYIFYHPIIKVSLDFTSK